MVSPEMILLRMLCRKPFFAKFNHLIEDHTFSCIEYASVRLAIDRIFAANPTAHVVRVTDIELALGQMVHDLTDYYTILDGLREIPVQPDSFRQDVVMNFLTRSCLRDMCRGILEQLENQETPDVAQVKQQIDDLAGGVLKMDQSVSYFMSGLDYLEGDMVLHPTGLSRELDIYASLGGGEIGIVFASPNEGKTTVLVNISGRELERGGNVLFCTMDEPAWRITRRHDQMFSRAMFQEIERNPSLALKARAIVRAKGGHLQIHDGKAEALTTSGLESHLSTMEKEGHKPTLVIVDYPDLLREPRQTHTKDRVDMIYNDLGRIGAKFGAPMWAGSQIRRDNYGFGNKRLDSPSDSIGKSEKATAVVSVERNADTDAAGKFYFKVLKSRDNPGRPMLVMSADWERQVIHEW